MLRKTCSSWNGSAITGGRDSPRCGVMRDAPAAALLADEEEDLLERAVHVGRAELRARGPREAEEALHRVREPPHLVAHLRDDLRLARVLREVLGEQLERAGEAGERVLDLVREAGRDLAHRREPVGPHHALAVERLELGLAAAQRGERRVEAARRDAELVRAPLVGADREIARLGPAHRGDEPLQRRHRLAPEQPERDGHQHDERGGGRERERPRELRLRLQHRRAREPEIEPAVHRATACRGSARRTRRSGSAG